MSEVDVSASYCQQVCYDSMLRREAPEKTRAVVIKDGEPRQYGKSMPLIAMIGGCWVTGPFGGTDCMMAYEPLLESVPMLADLNRGES